MDLWSGGVRATGGALNPPKCFWWLIDFRWDSSAGKWLFRRVKDFTWSGSSIRWQISRPPNRVGSLLTRDLDGSLVPIRQLEPFEAEKTLGVMMSPLDDGHSQFSFLLEKSNSWAEKVRSGRLLRFDVLPLLKSTIMKTLEYPMALTTFSQKQWFQLMSKPLLTCLPKAGICRNFPRVFAFAPLRYQGLGLPHPLVTQIFHHLSFIMKHLASPSQTTPFLKAVLEGHRLETGTNFEMFQQVYANTAILCSDTWAKKVWQEMDGLDIHLEPDTWGFDLLRERDALLMEIFMDASIPQEELRWLNWCRLYLNVVTVSDIVSADGRFISAEAWNGIRSSWRRSRFNWPRTARPSPVHWDSWRRWLSQTLLENGTTSRQLRSPLGPWCDDIEDWDWVFSPSSGDLFHRRNHVWCKCTVVSSSPRVTHRVYLAPSGPFAFSSLPLDVQRASVSFSVADRNRVSVTGLGQQSSPPSTFRRPPSVVEAWHEERAKISGSFGWVPNKVSVQGNERQLFLDLLAGLLCVISDGSFKNEIGAATVQIRSKDGKNVIWVYCQTPGKREDQSSYRSELIGLLAGVLVVSWLVREWSSVIPVPSTPTVQIGCDGLSALNNAFVFTWLHPAQPQFDLVSSLRVAIASSNVQWSPLHIKGHEDSRKRWQDLSWWEKRNVEADSRASQYRSQLERSGKIDAPNPRFFTEPCALFVKGEKASSLSRTLLEDLVILPQLRAEWAEHGRLSEDGFSQVDWEVVHRAMKSLPPGLQRWCTKHTVGMCGVGKFLHTWDPQVSPLCPMCEEIEDHRHVLRCQSPTATSEWNRRSEAFVQWLADFGTAPEITEALALCLQWVRDSSIPLQPLWWPVPNVSPDLLFRALTSQRMIGPQGFLEGLLSSQWSSLQQSYFRLRGSRRSGTTWAAGVAKQLILLGYYMWESRNQVAHSDNCRSKRLLSSKVDAEIRTQFGQDSSGLPLVARRQLSRPLAKILALPLASRQRWVSWIKLERSLLEKALRARQKMMFDFVECGRKRRRVFRTKRLSRTMVRRRSLRQLDLASWAAAQ